MADINGTIEVVRGRLSDERADALLRFWSARGLLDDAEARRRLAEVVCVVVDGSGQIAGVNSVYPAVVGSVGRQRFWVYRSFLLPAVADAAAAMVAAAFGALESEYDPMDIGPIGLCLLIADREELKRRPEARWAEPGFLYAGYLADGRQVRIAYFKSARVGTDRPPLIQDRPDRVDPGYRVELLAEQDAVDDQAVLDFWDREGAMAPEEAARRVREVLVVTTDEHGELVGVSSAYLDRSPQLAMDLWHFRSFVAERHRASDIALTQSLIGRDHLRTRFVTGEDTRAGGVVYEIENEALKRIFNHAIWPFGLHFAFIGENERGDHVRVYYFPGALAPDPPP
jgi:hypothetical protein